MLDYPPEFNTLMPMVAFYGPMASGKTYAAQKLFTAYHKFSLAAPLKATAQSYYSVTGKSDSERQILQELADDLKKWDNDTFTKQLLREVYNYYEIQDGNLPAIVDDLRFVHEADDLRRYGFKLVRVVVPEEVRMARVAEKYPDTGPARFQHRSEKQYKDIKPDFTISGEGEEGLNNLREILLRD